MATNLHLPELVELFGKVNIMATNLHLPELVELF